MSFYIYVRELKIKLKKKEKKNCLLGRLVIHFPAKCKSIIFDTSEWEMRKWSIVESIIGLILLDL